jgi:ADP-heptose:LPS heptosyltransferase
VAVTSVLLDAAKRRYPNARIIFVGPRKNYELFETDARIEHSEAPYARSGSLQARLEASAELSFPTGLVIDPDSRLTQLGLLRVCPDENYIFFNSRAFGGDSLDRLPDLAARWAADPQARPYVAPLPCSDEPADITISLGVGENPAKRIEGSFERDLLHKLAGRNVLVDLGGTPEERARVEQALPPGMRTHSGAFAPFAAQIARSKLFIGYDSAAGHVASACGVPLISIARGFTNPRMAARWRPLGTIVDNADDVLSSL